MQINREETDSTITIYLSQKGKVPWISFLNDFQSKETMTGSEEAGPTITVERPSMLYVPIFPI